MGPRIYPSYQDTNTTAKGSLIVSFDELIKDYELDSFQITVNGQLRSLESIDYDGLYTTNLNINDVVTFELITDPSSLNKLYSISRLDYTTDNNGTDNGLVYTFITGVTGTSVTGITFTATTLPSSYNFEYRITSSTDVNPQCDVTGYASFLPITGATKSAILVLSSIGSSNTSSWNIYTNYDSYTTPIVTGVSTTQLTSGYTVTNIPSTATSLKVKSIGSTCDLEPFSGITIGSLKTISFVTDDQSDTNYSATTITNTGSTLTWNVIFNNTVLYSKSGNNPSFDLDPYVGLKTFIISSSDNLQGLKNITYSGATYRIISADFNNAENLETLILDDQNNMTGFTCTGNTKLKTLNTYQSDLTTLDLSNNTLLENLNVGYCFFLDTITGFNNLTKLKVFYGPWLNTFDTNLDFSNKPQIERVTLGNSDSLFMTGLSNKSGFTYFELTGNNLITDIDLSNNPKLEYVNTSDCNAINNLNLNNIGTSVATGSTVTSGGSGLNNIYYSGNNISNLSIVGSYNLVNTNLNTFGNDLPYLKYLKFESTNITNINLTGSTVLNEIDISFNNSLSTLYIPNSLTILRAVVNILDDINISGATGLTYFDVAENSISSANLNTIVQNLINFNQSGTFFRSTNQTPCGEPSSSLVTQLDAIWTQVLVTICPTPTPTPSPTPTLTPTPTPSATPTITPTPIPLPFTTGYTVYYYANNTSSYNGTGTTWFDLSANAYNGTLQNGPVFVTGTTNYFDFDGTDDYVSVGTFVGLDTSSFSFGGWVRCLTGATNQVFYQRGQDGSGNGWSLQLLKNTSNRFRVQAVSSTNSTESSTNTVDMVSNQWYHIFGTWKSGGASELKLYVNGVKVGTTDTGTFTALRSSTVGWQIARTNGPAYANCDISSFELYNTVLTEAQINGNFQEYKSLYGY